ncbi:PIR Superfamily Protein [Plasmodium ovale wallikeri]|uniref:Plasmodium vivax Vir protein, putative n=2 Tax=Plasmodium ovale TaxID=36330 RepID=A0A1C3KJA1_PLAOA|nr:PIR Superfamily Protein [Plasmodium ovale wallikeri]SBT73976.1 Plasmodium vivax Vir protein, putative [Plasmodium ovale]
MENTIGALKKLESFKFDFMLNNVVTLCRQCKLCDNLSQTKKNEPWLKIFCYEFVRNLETFKDMSSYFTREQRISRCNSLIYWMHNKVNIYEKSEVNNKNNIINELLNVWREFDYLEVKSNLSSGCSILNDTVLNNLEEMKNKKKMSAYCENYDELKSLLTRNYTTVDCHIYYSYFKDSFHEFSKIATENKQKCLEIKECLRFCNNADPNNLINVANCKVVQISKDNDEYIEKKECDTLKDKAVAEKTCEPREFRISEFTFSDNRAIILILFALWGIFLSFLFLYKMTPFRAWISNKLGKKKIIRDNFNEQSDDETFDVDYETADRNMQNTEYNIIYNSDWNSSR